MFEPVPQRPDFPEVDARVLSRWTRHDVFARALAQTADGPRYRFFEGPPTANGRPGLHHVEARVFKDVFPRYRTMKGYHVPRRAGWDCHGIPVELAVERELGFSSKRDIESYGVTEFNQRCRESVERHVADFDLLTRRIGYWVDTDAAYWTMSDEYVDSVWWSLKSLFDRGLMTRDHRVSPYCPRCGTGLSAHEVAQGYQDVDDLSVFVRLPVISGPLATAHDGQPVDLLVWTTMPWTFVATTAAVIGTDIDYVLAVGAAAGDRPVVVARELMDAALGEGAVVVRPVPSDELLGHRYRGPFDLVGPGSPADPDGDPASWRVIVAGDFVTLDQGSGIVSTGAAFGEDDMRVAMANGLPVVNPVGPDGRFDADCGPFAGLDVRAADPHIVSALAEAGLLVRSHLYRHSYPFCWRCATPLIYYAKPSWFLRTTTRREAMIADNDTTAWLPDHIRSGRYGDWLRNNVDWALSRERYWGTPLPLWTCTDCGHVRAVGSRRELAGLSGRAAESIRMHRPEIDDVTFACERCGGESRRTPDVIDAWYDSGAMSFAQHGYPHVPGSAQAFESAFPADLVCEGIDQTRGWFYSLQAIATMLFDGPAYARALCLGHIVDEDGRKMSKSAGNVIDPFALLDEYGADAVRWLFVAEGNPWQPRRVTEKALPDITRRVLLPVWNTYYFFTTYANLADWSPIDPPEEDLHLLDRYVLAEVSRLVADVDQAMDEYDSTRATRRLAEFIEILSNWYVRLSRSRFGPTAVPRERDAALATLHTTLVTLTKLMAPFTPFIADEVFAGLTTAAGDDSRSSVHLESFPSPAEEHDERLLDAMRHARALVSLGRNARAEAGVPIRQALRRAVIAAPHGDPEDLRLVRDLVAEELNVKVCDLAVDSAEHTMELAIKANFRELGKVFGKRTPLVAGALSAMDPRAAARSLESTGRVGVEIDGEWLSVDADCVHLEQRPVTGWRSASDAGYSIALDVVLDDELRREGLARELSRRLNDLRKSSGLNLGQLADVTLYAADAPWLEQVLAEHRERIVREVLADAMVVLPPPPRIQPDVAWLELDDGVVGASVRAAP